MPSNLTSHHAPFHFHPDPLETIIYGLQFCWRLRVGVLSITFLALINCLLLLPFCVSILYLGVRRRQQKRATASHSDVFTYHMVLVELLNVGGSVLCCLGVHANVSEMQVVGIYLLSNIYSGQMFFHLLTCVDRYLAVVHPVTYMGLKKTKGIRMRNVVIACVWVLCFLGMGVLAITHHLIVTCVSFALIPVALVVLCFCSVSVLCALVRPGPGEGGGNRKQVDKTKMRAFCTIMVILGVLLVRFFVNICVNSLYDMNEMENQVKCLVWMSEFWFCLPTSLVLPLLFLHRAGKLSFCKKKSQDKHQARVSGE